MKLSYNWLNEFIQINTYTPEQITEVLNSIGIEVTSTTHIKPEINNVVVGKIIDIEKHPNADKLTLCTVTDGAKNYSIVCGAKNISKDDIIPVALPGAILPGNFKIETTKIRNVESQGMLCSEKELGLSDEHAGIMILSKLFPITDPKLQLGNDFFSAFNLEDTIFDVEIAANRGDCLNHLGIARELAAKLKLSLIIPQVNSSTRQQENINFYVEINEQDSELCSRYIGAVIENIAITQSPLFIKQRLINCGLRPINNIVDITNYVMLELGHPLHAFDYDKITDKRIIVKRNAVSQKVPALNSKEYAIDSDTLIISDSQNPLAIAGIIGLENSGISETTKTIILESAVFDPVNIRKTRQKLDIVTDSSYRFEHGTSFDICDLANKRAVELITKYASGRFTFRSDVYKKEYTPKRLVITAEFVNKILDTKYTLKDISETLSRLGMNIHFSTEFENKLFVEVPSFRRDIAEEIDLVEEIARIQGYETIPETLNTFIPKIRISEPVNSVQKQIQTFLCARGMNEVINYSLIKEWKYNGINLIELQNPISAEWKYLRPSLLPGLLKNVIYNYNNSNIKNMKFFELGKIFYLSGNNYIEKESCSILCTGDILEQNWANKPGKIDFYYLAGIIQELINQLGYPLSISEYEPGQYELPFNPDKSAVIINKENDNMKVYGRFGLLNRDMYAGDFGQDIYYGELYLNKLAALPVKNVLFAPYSKLPSSLRDISIIVPDNISYKTILNTILSEQKDNIAIKVQLFDIYKNKEKIGLGKKSFALALTFSSSDKTLTNEEINKKTDTILAKLSESGITLRSE